MHLENDNFLLLQTISDYQPILVEHTVLELLSLQIQNNFYLWISTRNIIKLEDVFFVENLQFCFRPVVLPTWYTVRSNHTWLSIDSVRDWACREQPHGLLNTCLQIGQGPAPVNRA